MNDSTASPPRSANDGSVPSRSARRRRRLLIGSLVLAVLVALYAAAGVWLVPRIVREKLPAFLAERTGLTLSLGAVHFNPFTFAVDANDIALRGPDGAPLLQAGQLAVNDAPTGLWRGRWVVDAASLTALQLNLVIAQDGKVNLVEALNGFAGPASAPAAAPPRIVVDRLDLVRASVLVTDLRGAEPAKATISPIDLTLTGLSTLPDQTAGMTLAAGLPDGATLRSQGDLVLHPALAAHGRIALHGLQAASWTPFLGGLLPFDRLQARADLAAAYAYTPQQGVRLNDIGLQVTDLLIATKGAPAPLLDVKTIDAAGGSLDLGARRFTAEAVTVEGGKVAVARNADGSIDGVRKAVPETTPSPSTPAGAEWHYDIGRLSLGTIDLALTDRTQAPDFDYGLRIESATAQHLANVDSAPVRFDARIAATPGGMLRAVGAVATDGSGLQARIEIDRLALAPFAGLVKRATGLDLSGGPLTLATNVHGAAGGLALDQLSVDLPNLRVQPPTGNEPLFSAARLELRGGAVSLAQHRVAVDRLTVGNGTVRAEVRPDSRLDWQAATPALPRAKAAAPTAPRPPWDVRITALQVQQMAVHYRDRAGPTPLRFDAGQVDVGLALQATTGARLQVAAQSVQATVKGVVVAVGSGGPPAFSLDSATLENGRVDLAARRVGASRLVLSGGGARIVRDGQGRIDVLDAFARTNGPGSSTASPAAPWQYAVDKIQLQTFAVAARDQAYTPPLAFAAHVDATIDHLSNTGPAAFDAVLALAQGGGTVKATGTATPATGRAQAHLVAESLDLTALQPLLSRNTTLQVKSGRVGSDLTLSYAPGASDAMRASGTATLDDLALDEAGSGAHLVSIARLDAREIDYASAGPRLAIGDIEVRRPDVRVAIAKDRSVNLAQVVRHAADEATPPTPQAVTPAPTSARPAPAFALSVQQVRLRDATVDFSDQSLVLPFATRVDAIAATIVGVSNDPDQRADVQAKGNIEPYGSASVNGDIVPADPSRHTDLEVKFNNVTLQPFSPYTATFAGRKVQSGKLWLDLGYKIDDGRLLGKNDIRLSQFTLGEQIESKASFNLPLNLAVSLLTDSKGEINLSVPVRGNLGDPHFGVGDAIAEAFKNTIGRIVSAPFRLIGRLFGGGDGSGDSLARVDFEAGSAVLAPEQREKLDALVKALEQRPLLQLVVGAPYDALADTLALQRGQARRRVAEKLGRAAGKGGASLVALDDPATRRALLALQPGAVAAPPADDRQAYEALFDRIARQQPLDAAAPQILATERAGRIASYLTEHGVDRNRVRTGEVKAVAADHDGTVDAELTVSAAAAPG